MAPGAEASLRPTTSGVRCPTCRGLAAWVDNPHRPFCSLICRLVDLGVWIDEGYRIEAEPFPAERDPDLS